MQKGKKLKSQKTLKRIVFFFLSLVIFLSSLLIISQSSFVNKSSFVSFPNENVKKSQNVSSRILQTANYEHDYIDKLNNDVQNAQEPSLINLKNYQYQKEVYPETYVDKGNKTYLGKYSYQTKIVTHETKEKKVNIEYSNGSYYYGLNQEFFVSDKENNNIADNTQFWIGLYKGNNYINQDFQKYPNVDPYKNKTGWTGFKKFYFNNYVNLNDHLKFWLYENTQKENKYDFLYSYPRNHLPSNAYNIKLKYMDVDLDYESRWESPNTYGDYDIFVRIKQIDPYLYYEYKVPKINYDNHLKSVYYNPVYIGDNHLQNHDFTDDELKNLIVLHIDAKEVPKRHIRFDNLKLDKQKNTISGQYAIGNYFSNQNSMFWQEFEIQIQNKITNHEKQIQIKPIFINENKYKNHHFTQNELTKLIHFENTLMDNVSFSNLQFDKVKKQIIGFYSISNLDNKQVKIQLQAFKMPFYVFNFNYLFTISPESATEWQHLASGKIKYWQKPPETIFSYNNDWIKSFYVFNKKQEIMNKFTSEINSWNLANENKKIVEGKIANYAINYFNYEIIKKNYLRNKNNTNYLNNLKPESFLDEYQHLKNINLENYLYLIQKCKVNFKIKANEIQKDFQNITLNNLDSKNIKTITLSEFATNDNFLAKTKWHLAISNLQITFSQKNFYSSPENFKPLTFKSLKAKQYAYLHNVNIETDSKNPTIIYHQYFYQAKGIDLGQDVSFVMENGTVLNRNFQVVKLGANKNLKLNDYAFVNTRYWATLSNDQKEFVTLVKKNNKWYSPKFQKNILSLDSAFQEEKLEYVFNQNLNMIVNPYSKSLNDANNPITSKDAPRYGIEQVTEIKKGQKIILETWDSGNFSHTASFDGKAFFDGVFGANTRGFYDPVGLLTEGNHQIQIDLKVAQSNFANKFNITIDKNPVEFKVNSMGNLKKLIIKDKNNRLQELWYSNQPINLVVKEVDIHSLSVWMLDSNGYWYDLPVSIKSVLSNKNWVQQIDTTFDYEGFIKIEIVDQAGNIKTVYFLTNKNDNELPQIKLSDKKIFKKDFYQGEKLTILDKQKTLLVTNPLLKNIKASKLFFNNKNQIIEENQNDLIDNYQIEIPSNYNFGKTLISDGTRLPYVVDELSPFKDKLTLVLNEKWQTHNKKITLNEEGLYKVELFTHLLSNPKITKYFYLNANKTIKIIDENLFTKDKAFFKDLPQEPKASSFEQSKLAFNLTKIEIAPTIVLKNDMKTKKYIINHIKKTLNYSLLTGDKKVTLDVLLKTEFLNIDIGLIPKAVFKNNENVLSIFIKKWKDIPKNVNLNEEINNNHQKWILTNQDQEINLLKKLELPLFNFQIKNLNIKYSLPWYSEFHKVDFKVLQDFKEGKYKITFEDIYGNKFNYQFLLLDKNKKNQEREKQKLIQIYLQYNDENTAFWKGDYIWNFWRYEDKDHAKWEYEQFLKDWIFNGLDPHLAKTAYKMAKWNPDWKGSFSEKPNKENDWLTFINNKSLLNKINTQTSFLNNSNQMEIEKNNFNLINGNLEPNNSTTRKGQNSKTSLIIGLSLTFSSVLVIVTLLLIRRWKLKKIL